MVIDQVKIDTRNFASLDQCQTLVFIEEIGNLKERSFLTYIILFYIQDTFKRICTRRFAQQETQMGEQARQNLDWCKMSLLIQVCNLKTKNTNTLFKLSHLLQSQWHHRQVE